ncbi:MAG: hypothetical protein KDE19_18510, partial [Caldilineaceae bacterium]|nr:hypothetical protein [Caldilineaceae bacterium]
MSSPKFLWFVTSLLLVAVVAFITFAGPWKINGLSTFVANQFGQKAEGEYIAPATTIEEISSITRYRMRMTLNNHGSDRWPDYVTGEGAYIVDPHAEEITLIYEEGENSQRVTMTVITDTSYLQDGEMVVQTPNPAIDLLELTLLDPKDATTLAYNFVPLEEEPINDRTTIHYQGDPKLLPTEAQASLAMLGTATLDLWVDKEENFIVAMAIRAYGIDGNADAS